MSSMPHENGCSCVECCYPQRSRPPVTEVGTATERVGACRAAAKTQCGRNGFPFMDDRTDEPNKQPMLSEDTKYDRDKATHKGG